MRNRKVERSFADSKELHGPRYCRFAQKTKGLITSITDSCLSEHDWRRGEYRDTPAEKRMIRDPRNVDYARRIGRSSAESEWYLLLELSVKISL